MSQSGIICVFHDFFLYGLQTQRPTNKHPHHIVSLFSPLAAVFGTEEGDVCETDPGMQGLFTAPGILFF